MIDSFLSASVGHERPVLTFASDRNGTLLAIVNDSNAVAQFDDEFNVKFWANNLRNWLALADQLRSLANDSFEALEAEVNSPGRFDLHPSPSVSS